MFYDGTTLLRSVAVGGGKVEFATAKLTSGKHSIKATYDGSIDFTVGAAIGAMPRIPQPVRPRRLSACYAIGKG